MEYHECFATVLNPLTQRTCFSQVRASDFTEFVAAAPFAIGKSGKLYAYASKAGSISPGRVCHSVPTLICTCSITAMIVCVFEHAQWRWALNDRLARG